MSNIHGLFDKVEEGSRPSANLNNALNVRGRPYTGVGISIGTGQPVVNPQPVGQPPGVGVNAYTGEVVVQPKPTQKPLAFSRSPFFKKAPTGTGSGNAVGFALAANQLAMTAASLAAHRRATWTQQNPDADNRQMTVALAQQIHDHMQTFGMVPITASPGPLAVITEEEEFEVDEGQAARTVARLAAQFAANWEVTGVTNNSPGFLTTASATIGTYSLYSDNPAQNQARLDFMSPEEDQDAAITKASRLALSAKYAPRDVDEPTSAAALAEQLLALDAQHHFASIPARLHPEWAWYSPEDGNDFALYFSGLYESSGPAAMYDALGQIRYYKRDIPRHIVIGIASAALRLLYSSKKKEKEPSK
ncbi:hypothetical protein B0H19DRAFT_1058814 [Mycena capillaripes]|nr:hypothetical protein B0H19DRAFT_1058814 [Mycena capillaripes]